MKNIILIILVTAILMMCGSMNIHAQADPIQVDTIQCEGEDLTCAHANTQAHGSGDYRIEIQRRFEENSWLKWDSIQNKGVFDCDDLLQSITDTTTGINEYNYVIINDQDYYESNPRVEERTEKRSGLDTDNECEEELYDEVTYETLRSHWLKEYFYYINNPQNDTKRFFLLTPGDYRDYQDLGLYHGGKVNEKKYILYYDGPTDNPSPKDIRDYFRANLCLDSSYHPDNRPDKQAIIERFDIKRVSGGNWVISGLTIRGNHRSYQGSTGGIFSSINADGNIIKSCVFENITGLEVEGLFWSCNPQRTRAYGTDYLVIKAANNNIITNCKFRKRNECILANDPMVDMIAIFIKATGGSKGATANNIIFDNDIKDAGDAIQLKPDFGTTTTTGGPGILIYNNRMYNDKFYYDTLPDGCLIERMSGEGAIDLKMGAGSWGCGTAPLPIEQKVIVANNDIYGWRAGIDNRGGGGEAIGMHLNAKNIAILDNHISDCTNGINIGGNIDLYNCQISHIEHIEVYDNVICNLYPSTQEYKDLPCYRDNNETSIGIKVNNESAVVADNIISNCVEGISMGAGLGRHASITDNSINGIYKNIFSDNNVIGGEFENFTNNTFINFYSVCTSQNQYLESVVVPNNDFLCPDGCQITGNICPYNEQTTCP